MTKAAGQPFYKNLYVQVLFAIAVGVLLGYFRPATAIAMEPLGIGFIKLIKMMIAPIIFCTVVLGISGMESMKSVGKTGALALLYFELLSTVALAIGLVVVNVVHPGTGMNVDASTLDSRSIAAYTAPGKLQGAAGFLLDIVPETIVGAFAKGEILQVLFFSILFRLCSAPRRRTRQAGGELYRAALLCAVPYCGHHHARRAAGRVWSNGLHHRQVRAAHVVPARQADGVLLYDMPDLHFSRAGPGCAYARLQHLKIPQVHQGRAADRAGYLIV
jgi:sodium:dicarboxylate symporter family protein